LKPRVIGSAAVLAAIATFAAPSLPAGALTTQTAGDTTSTGVSGGALFGGTLPLVAEQPTLGRKLAIVRMYYFIGQDFTNKRSEQVMKDGATVLASLDVPSHESYASVAAGKQDKPILTWLTQVNQDAAASKLPAAYVAFEHEANDPAKKNLGSPAQFIAAWKHIHALAAAHHLNWNDGGRLRWALILEHLAYFAKNQRPGWSMRLGLAQNYWAGAGQVDVVAADGYDRGGCRTHDGHSQPTQPSVSPGSIFNPVLTWAKSHGNLPVFLAEWASASYTSVPAWQSQFIVQMQAYVLGNKQIAAAMYWDQRGNFACRFSVTGNKASLTALAAMGKALAGHVAGQAPHATTGVNKPAKARHPAEVGEGVLPW
jgi:hypothetical protein